MKQSTMQWAREAISNIKTSLVTRIKAENLGGRDRQMMANMIADIQKEIQAQKESNVTIRQLYDNLGTIRKELTSPISKGSAGRIEAAALETERNLNELEKISHIASALQIDAQSIMPLLDQLQKKQDEMRQSFQKAVDIDFHLYGKTSHLTEKALEAYHFEVTQDRQVVKTSAHKTQPNPIPSPSFIPEGKLYQKGDRTKLKTPNIARDKIPQEPSVLRQLNQSKKEPEGGKESLPKKAFEIGK